MVKKGKKIRAGASPLPPFRAMPKRKYFILARSSLRKDTAVVMLHRLGRFVKSILGQTFTQLHRFIETGLPDEVVGKLSLKTMFQLSMNNDEFGKDKLC